MDTDGDFSAYASARWGALGRSAIVLGCTLDEAHDLVQATLVRCYTAWSKVQRADDPDAYVYVYRILLNCHRDSRRRRWGANDPQRCCLTDGSATRPTRSSSLTRFI